MKLNELMNTTKSKLSFLLKRMKGETDNEETVNMDSWIRTDVDLSKLDVIINDATCTSTESSSVQ